MSKSPDREIMTPETKARLRLTIDNIEAKIAEIEAGVDGNRWRFEVENLGFRCLRCGHVVTGVDQFVLKCANETRGEFLDGIHLCNLITQEDQVKDN